MLTSKFIRTDHVVDAVNWQFDAISGSSKGGNSGLNRRQDDSGPDYQRGLKLGLSEGFQAGVAHERCEQAAQLAALTETLDTAIASMQLQFAQMDEAVSDTLIDLAFTIATQVIRSDLLIRPESIVTVVREAVANLSERAMHPVVWLHPSDVAIVRTANAEPLEIRGCRIDTDPTLTRGGCRVESESMLIDATLETRLNQALASMGYSQVNRPTIENDPGNVATDY